MSPSAQIGSHTEQGGKEKPISGLNNLSTWNLTSNERVWKVISRSGISPETKLGIRENAKFIYGIRHLTASREAGLGEILAWDPVLGETILEIEMADVRDVGLPKSGPSPLPPSTFRPCYLAASLSTMVTAVVDRCLSDRCWCCLFWIRESSDVTRHHSWGIKEMKLFCFNLNCSQHKWVRYYFAQPELYTCVIHGRCWDAGLLHLFRA